jgi:hypothetical protein
MNQITSMLKDSNDRMRRLMEAIDNPGKIKNLDMITAAQREFEGQIKSLQVIVSLYGVSSKNRRAVSGLKKMNIMDDLSAVDLMIIDPEAEKVKCPVLDMLITRGDCLDYSGETANKKECSICTNGLETKRRLLPPLEA